MVALARMGILNGRGDFASVRAHIIETLAVTGDIVGELPAEIMRLVKVGAEAPIAAVMPVGKDLHIESRPLVICERIPLDLGNLELGFHAIMFHDVLLSGITVHFLGKMRFGTHLGVIPQVMDERILIALSVDEPHRLDAVLGKMESVNRQVIQIEAPALIGQLAHLRAGVRTEERTGQGVSIGERTGYEQ